MRYHEDLPLPEITPEKGIMMGAVNVIKLFAQNMIYGFGSGVWGDRVRLYVSLATTVQMACGHFYVHHHQAGNLIALKLFFSKLFLHCFGSFNVFGAWSGEYYSYYNKSEADLCHFQKQAWAWEGWCMSPVLLF